MLRNLFLLFSLIDLLAINKCVAQPLSLDPAVTVTNFMAIRKNAVRIEMCSFDGHLYYNTINGNIYRVSDSSGTMVDSLVANVSNHNANYLQGLTIRDSIIYIAGNHKANGTSGYGIVARAIIQPNGSLVWSSIITTVPYQSAIALYDHAFSCVVLNDAGDSLYINCGSRTDHGELQTINGQFPATRDVPLTSLILKVPTSLNGYVLLNDSAWLDATGFVYARGFRNNFDMAFNIHHDLIGVENSGDRDDPEEINWLRQGLHYGFPWLIGGHITPQQFPGYNPSADSLINHHTLGWTQNFFNNDSTFPVQPSITFTQPIPNYGPYADKYRDTTGQIHDASDNGTFIYSLTPHRAPLGLVFDRHKILGGNYTGDGLFLCYTIGTLDSSGYTPGVGVGPFLEKGQELLHLVLSKDTISQTYSAHVYPVITGFNTPVDAALDSNILYVIENRRTNDTAGAFIWKITFPLNTVSVFTPQAAQELKIFPNPSKGNVNIDLPVNTLEVQITNALGKIVEHAMIFNKSTINFQLAENGIYLVSILTGNQMIKGKIVICK